MDKSVFRGESFIDEETYYVYKEGQGRLIRSLDHQNLCFYNEIIGNWSRGILHGKRIEYRMNLEVFPVGYYEAYLGKNKKIESLSIVSETKRGVFNGPATILINDK